VSFLVAAAYRDLQRTGLAGATAVLLTALAVLVAGTTVAGHQALARLTAGWRGELRIVALLREDRSGAGGKPGVVADVQALPGVAAVRYVSSREALAELRQYLGGLGQDGDGLDRLPVNPVPARLVVTPALATSAAGLSALVDAIGRVPAVEEVQAAVGWVEPVEGLERGLTRGGSGLAALLGLAALGAIGGATSLARQRRADETAILRLAGVSEGRLRGPLLLQALVQGTAGAALGWSVLVLVSEVAAPWTAGWLYATLGLPMLPQPDGSLSAALLGAGVAGGLAGGIFAGRP